MRRFISVILCLVIITTLIGCGSKTDTLKISFSDQDLSGVNSAYLQNAHNGKGTYISDPQDVKALCSFISGIQGVNGESARGYYEGSYALHLFANESPTKAILKEEDPILIVAFGDSNAFFHGEFGDGYPVRYTLKGISIEEVTEFLSDYDMS